MADQFNILDYTDGPLLQTGQTTDRTPTGRTTKDDGGFQRGIPGSKEDNQYIILTTGQYSGSTNVTVNAIIDAHTNACVYDKVTGLMWNRETTAAIYGTGTESLLWDGTAASDEDIFNYIDQANIATLSGYSDWRVPNRNELNSILNFQNATTSKPNTAAFPVIASAFLWTSTSSAQTITSAIAVSTTIGNANVLGKTTSRVRFMLCRLGVE